MVSPPTFPSILIPASNWEAAKNEPFGIPGPTTIHSVPIEESIPALLSVQQVRDAYSRLAPFYGFWEGWTKGKARRFAMELANVRNGERVLEIAVGTGSALERLARSNPAGVTIGIDLTPAMLQRTLRLFRRRSLSLPRLCQCDARFLPFAGASFDLVFTSYMIESLAVCDIEKTFQEILRVLRPSGRLVLLHLSLGNPWFDRVWGALYWLIPTLLGGCRPIRVATYLPEAGFTAIRAEHATELGIPTEVVLAKRAGGPEDPAWASERLAN